MDDIMVKVEIALCRGGNVYWSLSGHDDVRGAHYALAVGAIEVAKAQIINEEVFRYEESNAKTTKAD